MAYTLVVVLLVDTITGDFDKNGIENKCDTSIVESVLQTANREFKLNIQTMKHGTHSAIKYERRVDNSLEDMDDEFSIENDQLNNIQSDSEYVDNLKYNKENTNQEKVYDVLNSNSSETTPFLVAIFETLSNVTAHTCAGTLLSPHWVLTSASCVDVLGYLRKNGTNSTESSRYTIIADALNPFIDGTAHNVTGVFLNPHLGMATDSSRNQSSLAMMRINPGVDVEKLDIVEDEISKNMEARVFGWLFVNNDSDPVIMNSVSIAVKIEPKFMCDLNISWREDLCLTSDDNDRGIVSQLSWGGAIMSGRRVLGVARAPGASPLHPHTSWIQALLIDTPS